MTGGGGGRRPPPVGQGGSGEPGCGFPKDAFRNGFEKEEDGRSPVHADAPASDEEGVIGPGEGGLHGNESVVPEASWPGDDCRFSCCPFGGEMISGSGIGSLGGEMCEGSVQVLDEMNVHGRPAAAMDVDASVGDDERPGADVHGGLLCVLDDLREGSAAVGEVEVNRRQSSDMEEDGTVGVVNVLLGAGKNQAGGADDKQNGELCFAGRFEGKGVTTHNGCGILPSPSASFRLDTGRFQAAGAVPSDDHFMRMQDVRGKVCAGFKLKEDGPGNGNVWQRPRVMALPPVAELGVVSNDGSTALLDGDEVAATSSRFQKALVGRLFGRRIPFHILSGELLWRWTAFGKFKIVTLSGDCFICMFDTVEARDAVLLGGPWILFGQVLGIDRWSPSFSLSSAAGFFTPVWVRLP